MAGTYSLKRFLEKKTPGTDKHKDKYKMKRTRHKNNTFHCFRDFQALILVTSVVTMFT